MHFGSSYLCGDPLICFSAFSQPEVDPVDRTSKALLFCPFLVWIREPRAGLRLWSAGVGRRKGDNVIVLQIHAQRLKRLEG